MIVTVTLNAALDITWDVAELRPRTSHRVLAAHERAGGKGINVARVLAFLGHAPVATGLVGGPTGRVVREDLRAAGIRDSFVAVAGDSRRTVAITSREDGDATLFNGQGPEVTATEWAAFVAHYATLVRGASVVVLSGSTPPGLPVDAYAHLIRIAAAEGASTVLDTSGPGLVSALEAGPDVIKPNAAEIAEVTGCDDLTKAASELRARGARTVVASAGPDGLYAITPEGVWRAAPPETLFGNPTGAGDACVAAIASGLADRAAWPVILCEAVALSAATVPCAVAGEIDSPVYSRFRREISVQMLGTAQKS
ncbi:Putative sugar kinase [Streptomyces venezuelae]|uniref:1-phosphofructokinase family hexose kinase n=1 Tax=Streptomyces gardneri TaxID=66892 RepID=UPI0006BCDB44|nr:1-phosphofructokinase family hexose kinase [Streptomyces gardneri]ALO12147.1 Putative sugar kinase [Streptomyces venezuelae]QPK48974.1 1-phosphofructokinase family hexose kinase [Streptomyces gardneri]WRK40463.1 1-phosphofructokinase family hexose kinase [Streptomyces venezuelae]CUM37276.1 1-phosphofructokinase [Streptomyces venezuelae]